MLVRQSQLRDFWERRWAAAIRQQGRISADSYAKVVAGSYEEQFDDEIDGLEAVCKSSLQASFVVAINKV